MATTATLQVGTYYKLEADYEVTNTDASTTVTFIRLRYENWAGAADGSEDAHMWVECDGNVVIDLGRVSAARSGVISQSYSSTFSRGHSASTKAFTLKIQAVNASSASTKSVSFNVPARPSYEIIYNSNLAANTQATQTKWYEESLTLKGQEAFPRDGFRIKEWNTSADGTGTSYALGAAYTANAALTLYAIWVPWIESVTIEDIEVIRTDSSSSTVESDEGTYAYVRVPFTVVFAANGLYTVDVTLASDIGSTSLSQSVDGNWAAVWPYGEERQSQSRIMVEEFVFDGISTERSYTVSVTVNASNISTLDQQAITVSKNASLPTAYYTMDVLGDGWLYNKTTDTSVVSGKTYYTQSGDGTPESPYEYEPVEYPVTSELAAYYEANGLKPGHGVSFGAPASREGFNVAMTPYYYGQAVAPVCVQSTEPSRTDVLWFDTGSTGAKLKYHNGSAWTPLPSVWG